MRMLHYCLGITIEEHNTKESIKQKVKITNVVKLMRNKKVAVVWTYIQKMISEERMK